MKYHTEFLPTSTGKTGKRGEIREFFPVREKSGNFNMLPETQGNIREFWVSQGNVAEFFERKKVETLIIC